MTTILIQSYVHYEHKLFLVSTVNREESEVIIPKEYLCAETIVWELEPKTMCRSAETLWIGEDKRGCIDIHMKVCRSLFESGTVGDD